MYGEDYEDEDELPPEVEYADLQRRFLFTAAGWVAAVALLYVLGFLAPGFAIVAAATGGVSALAFTGYWWNRRRGLMR